jgi:hypothetical protein
MANEDNNPGTNFPGFSFASTVTTSLINLLTDQASVVNDAWRKVKAGKYGVGDYMRGASEMWESYLQTASDITLGPFRADVPKWVNFLYSRKDNPALKRTVYLARQRDPSSVITVTSLHALNGNAYISPQEVQVQVSPASIRRANVEISVNSAQLKDQTKVPNGDYIGFVYDRHASGGSPMIVILLTVTD